MLSFRVEGLRRLDALDIKKRHPDASIAFEEHDISDPEHGELATAALVVVSLAGLQVLATWLLKNRKGTVIERTLEIVEADGTRRTEKLRVDLSESTAPDADVIEGLAAIAKVDLSKL